MAEKKRMTTRLQGTLEAARYGCESRRDESYSVVTTSIGRVLHVRLFLANLLRDAIKPTKDQRASELACAKQERPPDAFYGS